jgi:hypothetical protein
MSESRQELGIKQFGAVLVGVGVSLLLSASLFLIAAGLEKLESKLGWTTDAPWIVPLGLFGLGIALFIAIFSSRYRSQTYQPSSAPPFSIWNLARSLAWAAAFSFFCGWLTLYATVHVDLPGRIVIFAIIPGAALAACWFWFLLCNLLHHRLKPQNAMGEAAITRAKHVGIDDPAGDERKSSTERE